jgi:hypothetical protein
MAEQHDGHDEQDQYADHEPYERKLPPMTQDDLESATDEFGRVHYHTKEGRRRIRDPKGRAHGPRDVGRATRPHPRGYHQPLRPATTPPTTSLPAPNPPTTPTPTRRAHAAAHGPSSRKR